jgi:hypothetical protein
MLVASLAAEQPFRNLLLHGSSIDLEVVVTGEASVRCWLLRSGRRAGGSYRKLEHAWSSPAPAQREARLRGPHDQGLGTYFLRPIPFTPARCPRRAHFVGWGSLNAQ